MLNKSKKGNNKISLKLKDNLVDDDAEVASAFNEFFCSIAQNLQDKIPDYGNFQDYVTGLKSSNSFFFTAVTKSEMSKVIKSLNFTKGTGVWLFFGSKIHQRKKSFIKRKTTLIGHAR